MSIFKGCREKGDENDERHESQQQQSNTFRTTQVSWLVANSATEMKIEKGVYIAGELLRLKLGKRLQQIGERESLENEMRNFGHESCCQRL